MTFRKTLLLLIIIQISGFAQKPHTDFLFQNFTPLINEHQKTDRFDQIPLTKLIPNLNQNIRIVAVAEAVHGSNEFLNLQKKVALDLVSLLNYDTIVLAEFGLIESLSLNEYIQTETDVLDQKIRYPKDFFDTLRDLNNNRKPGNQIRIIGADIDTDGQLIDYLKSLGKNIPKKKWFQLVDKLAKSLSQNTKRSFREVEEIIQALEDELQLNWQNQEAEITNRILNSLRLNNYWKEHNGNLMLNRDNIMFQNISWLASQKKGTKMIIISVHNFHANKITLGPEHIENSVASLGEQLSKKYGNQYYSIGTEAESGKYLTVGRKPLRAIVTEASKLGTLISQFYPECIVGNYFPIPDNGKQLDSIGLTITNGTYFSRASLVGSKINKAFDQIIYVKELRPIQLSNDKVAQLFIPLTESELKSILSDGEIRVETSGSFAEDAQCYVSIYFHDKKSKLTGSYRTQLDKTEARQKIPQKTKSISINLIFKDTEEADIQSIKVNNETFDLKKLKFYDWNDNYEILRSSSNIKIKDLQN